MSKNASSADNQQGSLSDPSETKRIFVSRKEFMKPLSKKTNQLILGTVLGDGYIQRHGKNCRLMLCHSPKQKEYLEWKYRLLLRDNLIQSSPYLIMVGKNKKYPQWRCQTLSLPIFCEFRRMFYFQGRKKITRKLLNQLTPLGLAVWYMDDGSITIHKKKHSRELHLNTYNHTKKEHEIIQYYFRKVWNISVKISKNKGKYRIALNITEGKKFLHLIKSYIINCMKYKINLGYIKNSR